MNYYIVFIAENGEEWTVLTSEDFDYIERVFEELSAPPQYNTELRQTAEDIDTALTYEVVRYDHSNF